MMRALFLLLALVGLFPALPACTPLQTAPIENVQQAAQAAVNEANALIYAVGNVIAQNVTDGTMTRDEAQRALDKLLEHARKVDEAQALIRAGEHAAAQPKAQLAHQLILALHREVASKARSQ